MVYSLISKCHAKMGNVEEAIDWLKKVKGGLWTEIIAYGDYDKILYDSTFIQYIKTRFETKVLIKDFVTKYSDKQKHKLMTYLNKTGLSMEFKEKMSCAKTYNEIISEILQDSDSKLSKLDAYTH